MDESVKIGRNTIVFFLPNSMEAVMSDQSPNTLTDEGAGWYKARLYMNPQSFNIRDKKIVKSDLTKGGFVTQYWGEDLTKIEIRGTTGSAGIQGINVLRSIYRHEQAQMINILEERQNELAKRAAAASTYTEETQSFGEAALNVLTGGAFSQVKDGLTNAIDLISDAYKGRSSGGRGTFVSAPTLAALATSVDMYHDGEFFRGYFDFFNVDETAAEPGHFTYSFSFTVLRRSGRRDNFMPWHREPLNSSGETMMSKNVTETKGRPNTSGGDNYTFPIGGYQSLLVDPNPPGPPDLQSSQEGINLIEDGISFPLNRQNDS